MTLRFLTAGESHGPGLTVILDGFPAGIQLSEDWINQELARRQQGYGSGARMKIEKDTAKITSGVMEGVTTGAPLSFWIENRDHTKWLGKPIPSFTIPRPGHADLTGTIKYGYSDLRPALERASARETAARVAVGATCKQFLNIFSITVGGYVVSLGSVSPELPEMTYLERFNLSEKSSVRFPSDEGTKEMEDFIRKIKEDRETLGGVIEVFTLGVPPGLGSYVQWDRRLDAQLGAAVLSIQAVKGVEIGSAFENTRFPGSQVQDPIQLDKNQLLRPSNRSGGLEGGITNGQPVVIRAAMKPIATTLTPQRSVDLMEKIEVSTRYERSDFCPVARVVPIVEAMVAFVISRALIEKIGGDSIREMKPRFDSLPNGQLSDFQLDGKDHTFWSI